MADPAKPDHPIARVLLVLSLAFCLTPWASPPIALAIGILLALLGLTAWPAQCKRWSKVAIQAGIVVLGLWISLQQVARAGLTGLALSTGAIVVVLVLSLLLEKLLRPTKDVSTLLASGTAICGGSAIAATGTVIGASSGSMGIATAIVFLLNAVGVYVYPLIGHALEMTEQQFGAWAAIGVHDVAGVVAAAKGYTPSDLALEQATVIKLTRVLWIVPVAMILGWIYRRSQHTDVKAAKSPFPWFIVIFLAACGLRAVLDQTINTETAKQIGEWAKLVAGKLLSIALLLIGTGLSRSALRTVGWRALAMGVILWVCVSVISLLVVRAVIH
ncbi:MAG: YeiH family protein [Phycisphaerales bacterium]